MASVRHWTIAYVMTMATGGQTPRKCSSMARIRGASRRRFSPRGPRACRCRSNAHRDCQPRERDRACVLSVPARWWRDCPQGGARRAARATHRRRPPRLSSNWRRPNSLLRSYPTKTWSSIARCRGVGATAAPRSARRRPQPPRRGIWPKAPPTGVCNCSTWIQNPGTTATTVRVELELATGAGPAGHDSLSRRGGGAASLFLGEPRGGYWASRVGVGGHLGDRDVTRRNTDLCRAALYKSGAAGTFAAGHAGAGITTPQLEWFLAEGATGDYFDTFVLIANPGTTEAVADVTFLLPDGSTIAARSASRP